MHPERHTAGHGERDGLTERQPAITGRHDADDVVLSIRQEHAIAKLRELRLNAREDNRLRLRAPGPKCGGQSD